MLQELFSRNGFTFWLENPTNRQSSCSCSVTYLTISAQACVTGIRWMDASRRSWSTMLRCCCRLLAIKSMTAVSERPMVNDWRWLERTGNGWRVESTCGGLRRRLGWSMGDRRSRKPQLKNCNNKKYLSAAKMAHTYLKILIRRIIGGTLKLVNGKSYRVTVEMEMKLCIKACSYWPRIN